jgi:hypothetical protein
MAQVNHCRGQDGTVSTNQNFGYSSRLAYDESAYRDKLDESTSPLKYRLNSNQIYNCDACLSTLGPRSSYRGYGVSMPVDNDVAVSQAPEMVNIESILTNRNMSTSKDRRNEVNPIDVTKFKVRHPRICNEFLNPQASRLTLAPSMFRDMGVSRFYDLGRPIQRVIYWPTTENTKLQAKDNFMPDIPKLWSSNMSLPHELKSSKNNCKNIRVCAIGENSVDY